MKYDIATPEGKADAVRRQTQAIASFGRGGRWIASGRSWDSFEIFEIDHEHKVARVCIDVTPTPDIITVFYAMGWRVVEADGVTPVPEHSAEQVAEEHQRQLRYKAKADTATRNLYNAVRRGDIKGVAALLERGANAAACAPDGSPLIDLAMAKGFDAIAAQLRDAAAS